MNDNPFKILYDSLWALVDGHKQTDTIVREGNRIKFQSRSAAKRNVSTADLPEIGLVPNDTIGNLLASSNDTQIQKDFDWTLSSGSMDLTRELYDLEWLLLTAMVSWSKKINETALWKGKQFVKNVQIVNARTGMSNKEFNRGIKGWVTVLRVQVHIRLTTADMIGETE